MNLVDVAGVGIVGAYVAAGFFTGVVRRAIGLGVAYLAFLVATNMGQQGGQMLQQNVPTLSSADARAYGFLFFFLLIVLILEGAAFAIRDLLRVSFVLLNRATGIAVGLLTAGMVIFGLSYVASGYANPIGGAAVTVYQEKLRDYQSGSHWANPLAGRVKEFYFPILDPVLPRDPSVYFGSLATPQQ